MGISIQTANLLIREATRKPFSGSVLQLGRQDIYFDECKLRENVHKANQLGASLTVVDMNAEVNDTAFFKTLGFDEVRSLDFCDYERADIIFDLNHPVPKELHNQFDAIFDGGTMEHCFHIPQVLENIFNMLKVGGRVIHGAPSNNHVDHGFYMFSPTLFCDYYLANKWHLSTCQIFTYAKDHINTAWRVYDYSPGFLDHLSFGGFEEGEMLGIWCIAEKNHDTVSDVIPQQSFYKKAWNNKSKHSKVYPDYVTFKLTNGIIFGTGQLGIEAFNTLGKNDKINYFVDNNIEKQGTKVNGCLVISPETLVSTDFDYIVIASQAYEAIFEQLKSLKISNNKIAQYGFYGSLSKEIRGYDKLPEPLFVLQS